MVIIGVDLGGTKIAAGIVDRKGKILKRAEVPTGAGNGKEFIIDQLRTVITLAAGGKRIDGVGIGVPGLYDGTRLTDLPNVRALDGVDIKKALKLKARIVIENDARCFALGEFFFGAGKGSKSMIGIILGTGVGSGIIVDGRIVHGGTGAAGEIGHMRYERSWTPKSHGYDWESLLSGPSIVKRHKARGGTESDPASIWNSPSALAQQTRDDVVRDLAVFIANLQTTLDPDVVVLGGGVSNLPLDVEVNKLLPSIGGKANVKRRKLGIDAAILGAAMALNE